MQSSVAFYRGGTGFCIQGVLGSGQQARQVFERISPADLTGDADARFDHFRKALWPNLRERTGATPFFGGPRPAALKNVYPEACLNV